MFNTAIQGLQVYGEHRGHRIYVTYHPMWERADVDVMCEDSPYHYAFELAIMNASKPRLGARLLETCKCWVDGAIAQRESAAA